MSLTGAGSAPVTTQRASDPAARSDASDASDRSDRSPGGDGLRSVRRWGAAVAAAAWVLVLGAPRLGRRPFWLDEAFTVGATHDLVTTWRRTGGTMALYYLLVWPMAQVSVDRAWLRLLSLVCAAATVVVVHEIGRRIAGARMGAMAAGLLAATWAIARFGLEARSYTLAMLLVALSWLGLVAAVIADGEGDATVRRRWWRLFVVATLLAPLAHGLAALHFVGQVAVLGLAPGWRRWWRACVPMAAALAVEGALLFSLGAGEVANWIAPLNHHQVEALLRFLIGKDLRLALLGPLALLAAALGGAGLVRARRSAATAAPGSGDAAGVAGAADPVLGAWLRLVPVFWMAGVPLLIAGLSLVRPYGEPRYVIGAVPGVALVLAGLLARLRPATVAAAAWVVVALVLATDQPSITRQGSEDWPALVRVITDEGHDGDRLLMPAMVRAPFDYAWNEDPDGRSRPDLVALSPTDPVGGGVLRFYDVAPGGLRAQFEAPPSTSGSDGAVWYVDRDIKRRDDVDALIADPGVARRYEVTGRWEMTGELYLVRLEPRTGTTATTAGGGTP